jgi:hypothetical protein
MYEACSTHERERTYYYGRKIGGGKDLGIGKRIILKG